MREMQEQIDEIMDNFDFERVHRMMNTLDWKWVDGDGEFSVPDVPELRKTARRLLYQVIDEGFIHCGSGGFNVSKGENWIVLQWGPEYMAEEEA